MPRLSTLTAVLLCVAIGPASAGEKQRPATIDDIMQVRHINETAITPDGRSVAYVVSEADLKQGRYNTDIWMVPSAGGPSVKLTNGPGRDDTPRWAPDSKTVGFLSDRDGKPQVWLIGAKGGEARKL